MSRDGLFLRRREDASRKRGPETEAKLPPSIKRYGLDNQAVVLGKHCIQDTFMSNSSSRNSFFMSNNSSLFDLKDLKGFHNRVNANTEYEQNIAGIPQSQLSFWPALMWCASAFTSPPAVQDRPRHVECSTSTRVFILTQTFISNLHPNYYSSVSQSGPYRPPGGVEEMQGGGRRVRLEWGAYITV
ncbi:hypothetical protein FHG87_019752 [Trinorchestia longiramus]|nr:hypothetical protein FHG87_019752 [Trinorchestia longiramus]